MDIVICCRCTYPVLNCNLIIFSNGKVFAAHSNRRKRESRKLELPKNLRNPRRTKLPPDFYPAVLHSKESVLSKAPSTDSTIIAPAVEEYGDETDDSNNSDDNLVWELDEIEAISSLFKGRVPQKPGNINRERPLPPPVPHKIRPLGLPTPKKLTKNHLAVSARQPISNQIYKNPTFLIGLAREIRSLPPETNMSTVLSQWARFLRKGSLSLTVRELGHMGLPDRALHVFCWVQNQPHLFPDDRILASTVEVLARANELKIPFDLDKFTSLAGRNVYEAMVKGFIRGGNLSLAWELLYAAKEGKRMLDSCIYAKLILALGKNPDKIMLSLPLLEELAARDDLKLTPQDCTSIMKVCIKLGKFDIVESLYDWFKKSGTTPTVVMQTTLIHSRYSANKYREAMAVVWEMEASNTLFDLPAYRTLIKLFIALNDFSRTSRYFSKLKESGLAPAFDIYCELISFYLASGRLAKCKHMCQEAEMAGFMVDDRIRSQMHLGR
ncbi:pentatricopeptide repeat-containing protein [Dorcoceras hygrometricum]|uniref:Pentatricopeptide repeat-containing protein n=1 Tax=Dorcoceras hygrometricum TaxID=472368 RepID=A0A2Z7ABM9_9LAMI|nr:pentatricopeptide repeat-containing protein [Dorcoceras hygrometricum]